MPSPFPPPPVPTAGTHLRRVGVYVFECPVCHKRFRHDDPYEPLCTGPHETLDEHDPTVMRRVYTDRRRVAM